MSNMIRKGALLVLYVAIVFTLIGAFIFSQDTKRKFIIFVGIGIISLGVSMINTYASEPGWLFAICVELLVLTLCILKAFLYNERDENDEAEPQSYIEKVLYYEKLSQELKKIRNLSGKTVLTTMCVEYDGYEYRCIKFCTTVRKKKLERIPEARYFLNSCIQLGGERTVEIYEVHERRNNDFR